MGRPGGADVGKGEHRRVRRRPESDYRLRSVGRRVTRQSRGHLADDGRSISECDSYQRSVDGLLRRDQTTAEDRRDDGGHLQLF